MERVKQIEADAAQLACYLQGELGFQSDLPGALRGQVLENRARIRDLEDTLRGRGGEMGLVGWNNVLRRTWITLVALLGAALGYVLNDVVDALPQPSRRPGVMTSDTLPHRQVAHPVAVPTRQQENPHALP
jgi:hypothetical protein